MTNYDKKYYSDLWNSIDFEKAQDSLDNFQERLAIASKEKNWNKVKHLQQFITDSIEIRCLVVKNVIQDSGRRPGVDGILWISDSDKAKGACLLPRMITKLNLFVELLFKIKIKQKNVISEFLLSKTDA